MSSHHFILFLYLTYHVIMFFKATLGGLSEHIGTHSFRKGGMTDAGGALCGSVPLTAVEIRASHSQGGVKDV